MALHSENAQDLVGAGFSRSRAAKRHFAEESGACGARDRLKPAPTMFRDMFCCANPMHIIRDIPVRAEAYRAAQQ